MTDIRKHKGVEYHLGPFHNLLSSSATEWEERLLRILADIDRETRIQEFNYDMYLLAKKTIL